jgi:uncharacterized membrane protein YgaE (UPF0421/DUF939 family)
MLINCNYITNIYIENFYGGILFMRILKLPNVGYRNIKTALAVLICLLIVPKSLFAPIAAIISMQSTLEDSLETGINRLIGTFLGGISGVIILYIIQYLNLYNYSSLIGALSVSLIIYLCNVINKPAASSIASIVILGIIIDPVADISPIQYSFNRTIETVIGVVIAIIINKYINPPADSDLNLLEFNKDQENDEIELESLKTNNKIENNLDLSNVIEEDTESLNLSVVNKKDDIESVANSKNEYAYTDNIKSEKNP